MRNLISYQCTNKIKYVSWLTKPTSQAWLAWHGQRSGSAYWGPKPPMRCKWPKTHSPPPLLFFSWGGRFRCFTYYCKILGWHRITMHKRNKQTETDGSNTSLGFYKTSCPSLSVSKQKQFHSFESQNPNLAVPLFQFECLLPFDMFHDEPVFHRIIH